MLRLRWLDRVGTKSRLTDTGVASRFHDFWRALAILSAYTALSVVIQAAFAANLGPNALQRELDIFTGGLETGPPVPPNAVATYNLGYCVGVVRRMQLTWVFSVLVLTLGHALRRATAGRQRATLDGLGSKTEGVGPAGRVIGGIEHWGAATVVGVCDLCYGTIFMKMYGLFVLGRTLAPLPCSIQPAPHSHTPARRRMSSQCCSPT